MNHTREEREPRVCMRSGDVAKWAVGSSQEMQIWRSSKGVDPEKSAVKRISISKLARPASACMKENKRPIQTLMEEIERPPKTNRRAFDYLASCRQEKKKTRQTSN
ncbi:hypothetical protein NC653_005551 [Populus alba x Populus x berolinensis]|uniref:Uncharacterized protein n=1 Tax=Populus alba x Populus x berolinensis TaxID=444605 RepID=A0AAD6RCH3_9ROSI|nr:hypothetical protein NC653_005551 [Populus alba x Populus x berolinensis]